MKRHSNQNSVYCRLQRTSCYKVLEAYRIYHYPDLQHFESTAVSATDAAEKPSVCKDDTLSVWYTKLISLLNLSCWISILQLHKMTDVRKKHMNIFFSLSAPFSTTFTVILYHKVNKMSIPNFADINLCLYDYNRSVTKVNKKSSGNEVTCVTVKLREIKATGGSTNPL